MLGKCKPPRFAFPLVSLHPAHVRAAQPVHLALPLHQGQVPACVFSCVLFSSLVGLVGWSFFSLSLFFSCVFALHACAWLMCSGCSVQFSCANFCFGCLRWCVFVFLLFCLCFCLVRSFFLSRQVFEKFSSCQVLVFGVRSLCFRFRDDVVVFFRLSVSFLRETDQANRTPHFPARLVGFSFFLCLSPGRSFCCPPFFGRASFCFWRFSGCHSGPQVFLGFSLDSLILVLGREAARAFGLFLVFVAFGFPFCRVCGLTR